jgi:hypothetical protein
MVRLFAKQAYVFAKRSCLRMVRNRTFPRLNPTPFYLPLSRKQIYLHKEGEYQSCWTSDFTAALKISPFKALLENGNPNTHQTSSDQIKGSHTSQYLENKVA